MNGRRSCRQEASAAAAISSALVGKLHSPAGSPAPAGTNGTPLTNPLLLAGIAAEVAFAFLLMYTPALHVLFGIAALSVVQLALVVPYPFIIWGADELRRAFMRSRYGP